MRRFIALSVALASAFSVLLSAQQQGVLKAAADALGAANIRTIQVTGSGTNFSVGQNFTPSEPWPPVPVRNFTALINYDTASMRQELLRVMGTVMPRGGGAPFTGEQRQILLVSGNYAWNLPAPAPAPATGGAPAGGAPPAVPVPLTQLERTLFIWSTPQGFIRAAIANNATTTKSKGGTDVSFTIDGKYKLTGTIDAQNRVERVRTWIDHPIVGDMPVETVYSGYKDFGGVLFPSRIVQSQDGFTALDLMVSSVRANAPADITVPENVRNATPPPTTVTANKLAGGVFHLTGGTHHSLAVEMKDHIVLADTPNGEVRALAVIAKAKEVIPGKPIRYLVTSHHHWDHLGGIRAAMDEGATIVTHQSNEAFLKRVAKTAHTIAPDRLAASKKSLKIRTVGTKGTLTDGTRTVELHLLTGYEHTGDMLVMYLPKEKILAEPDAFTAPATPTTPLVVTAVPYAAALYDNIQRLKLDVQTIAPFHGTRTTDVAELARAAGRSGLAKTN